jgi:hypothetical protein
MARQQLSSPFQSFVAGRDARQQHDYGQTRNKLAEMELADAPAQMQRRNALADVQLQGAQVGLEGAQQQLGAEKAQFAYAKLKQALDSGNPKAFIMQQIPDLASKLQQQGIDLNSMDDQSVAQLTDNLARKYAGEAGIAPAQPKTPEAFTLGSGQTRYGPDGKPIASVPVAAQKPDRFAETQAAADRRAAEARAHAERMAQQQREFSASQNDLNRQAAAEKSQATIDEKAKKQQLEIDRTLAVYEQAKKGLVTGLGETTTGPFVGRAPAISTEQQVAEGAVAAMAPVLKQLFRAAGEGVFTDRDQALLMDMVPTRKDRAEARKLKMENIDRIVRAKLGMSQDGSANNVKRVKVDAQGNVIGN